MTDEKRPGIHREDDSGKKPSDSRRKRRPFPLHLLPAAVRALVLAIARSRSVDPSVPAGLSLAALGTAIGLSRVCFDDYADWEEVPVIWFALVSSSGTRKTTLIEDLFFPHQTRQKFLHETYLAEEQKYLCLYAEWERTKRDKSLEIPPPPAEPKLEHVLTTNSTPEALVGMLASSPRGILILNDELVALFGAMGRYSGKADADRGFYLSLFRGTTFKNDRKGEGTTILSKAAASIAGGIQPGILRQCFDRGAFQSGLAPRFLLVYPPPLIKEYRQGPSGEEKAAYASLVEGLFRLRMEPLVQEDGGFEHRPLRVPVSEEVRELLREFVPLWSAESLAESENVEAAMAKLEGYALRFALILRCCREVTDKLDDSAPISRADLEAGIELARWFRDEALFVYGELATSEDKTPRSKLLARTAIIRSQHGGAVTQREWHKRNTRRSAEEAKQDLDELVADGLAVWRDRPAGPGGGRPTTECALIDVDPAEETPGGFGVQPPVPGEVSGCGLRGASEPAEPADPTSTPSDGLEKGFETPPSFNSDEDCTPEPPDPSRTEDGCTPQPETRNPLDEVEEGERWEF